jgi:hypothetical protein
MKLAGFSYLETTIAIFMLIVGFLGIYASFEASAAMRETANETNVAMFKLQTVQESVFSMAFDDVPVKLPPDTPILLENITDSLPANDFKLRDEVITVSYLDPANDPLFFTAKIVWTSRNGVPREEEISCARGR